VQQPLTDHQAIASSLSRLHNHTHNTPHSVRLLWMSDQPFAGTILEYTNIIYIYTRITVLFMKIMTILTFHLRGKLHLSIYTVYTTKYYSLAWVFLPFVHVVFWFVSHVLSLVLSCLVVDVDLAVCIVVVVLCVLLSSYVYLLYCMCIAVYFRCRTAG